MCVERRWYLVAWDLDREDWRTFRLDRVQRERRESSRFVRRTLPRDARDLVSDAVTSAPYRYEAKVVIHASAGYVAERMPANAARIAPRGPASCTLSLGARSVERLATILCTLDVDFEVVEPPELIAAVRTLAERCGRAVSGSTRNAATAR